MSYNITGSTLFRNLRTRVDITVETIADRDALLTYRRRWGMVVAVYDDPTAENNGLYYLKKGLSNDILGSNDNWKYWDTDIYTHPTGFEDQPETPLSGSTVISQVEVNDEGHVTGVKVRDLGTSLEWNETTAEYNTSKTLLDLTGIATGDISSFYICVTALFGVKHESPAKKVSMVATRISEFAVHEDFAGNVHGAHVKTQHTGVYAKYGSQWTNSPAVLPVNPQDIKIMISGTNLVVLHKFDKGENIEPVLSCKYRIDLQTLTFE